MKFLIDQNLRPRLKRLFEGRFPGTQHVIHLHLDQTRDHVLWRYATEHGFALMTQDDDFHQRSMLNGAPPKVVYLSNAKGDAPGLAAFVDRNIGTLAAFMEDTEASLLILKREGTGR